MSLRALHVLLVSLSIILATGFGVWELFNHGIVLGLVSLAVAVGLVVYGGYFVGKAERIHLE